MQELNFSTAFCTINDDKETNRINDFAVIYDTENRIIGNGEKWLQPLNLAGVVAIFLFKIRHGGRLG